MYTYGMLTCQIWLQVREGSWFNLRFFDILQHVLNDINSSNFYKLCAQAEV